MIFIQVTNKKWNPAKFYLKEYDKKVQHDFEVYLADRYVSEIRRCIQKQTLKKEWKPLNPIYKKFKKKQGLSTKIWVASSRLRNNLKVIPKANYLVVGWDENLRYERKKNSLNPSPTVLQVARKLEYGSLKGNIPPRPLFRIVLRRMETDMEDWVNRYLTRNKPEKRKVYKARDTIKDNIKKGRELINELFGL